MTAMRLDRQIAHTLELDRLNHICRRIWPLDPTRGAIDRVFGRVARGSLRA